MTEITIKQKRSSEITIIGRRVRIRRIGTQGVPGPAPTVTDLLAAYILAKS